MAQWMQEPDYRAYILRIWKESGRWRFSIEPIGPGRQQGFASVEQVATFLLEVAPAIEKEARTEIGTE